MKKFVYLIVFPLLLACSGGGSGGDDSPQPDKVTSLQIYLSETTTIVGQSLIFSVIFWLRFFMDFGWLLGGFWEAFWLIVGANF